MSGHVQRNDGKDWVEIKFTQRLKILLEKQNKMKTPHDTPWQTFDLSGHVWQFGGGVSQKSTGQ